MNRLGDQALDLLGNDQPQQHAENQDAEAGGQGAGVERGRQFAAGYQQQMTGQRAGAGQGNDLVAAEFTGLPSLHIAVMVRQLEFFGMLQLRQAFALAVVQCRRPQRCVAVELVEQALGALWRLQGVGDQAWIGHQPANGLQGLGCHAFLGNVVGGADKGQVGHQQDSGQQHQQGGQQFLADREVFKALAQWHQTRR